MPESLPERIKNALDVSGAFDNCFFHTYALHLLANELPLPKDLFTFQSILGKHSLAKKIQEEFPNFASLSLFGEYFKHRKPREEPASPQFIVEKTLVLGFLLREWFATQMAQKAKHGVAMQTAVIQSFKSYVELRPSLESYKDLSTGEEGVLYEANRAFLEYASFRPKTGPLSKKERDFEHYFSSTNTVETAFAAYWSEEGYQNYCLHCAKTGIKISINEVTPVLEMIGQPVVFYHKNSRIMSEIAGASPMEVMLNETGHYYLLHTEKTTDLLGEYAKSHKQYVSARAEILACSTNKIVAANKKSSLLVGAVCPGGHLNDSPVTVFFDKIKLMKDANAAYKHSLAIEVRSDSKNIDKIDAALAELQAKTSNIDQHASAKACEVAAALHDALTRAREAYVEALKQPDVNLASAAQKFTDKCTLHINIAYPILEQDLHWGPYLRNLLKTLVQAVVKIVTLGMAGTFFTAETSPSSKAVLEAQEALKPEVGPEEHSEPPQEFREWKF